MIIEITKHSVYIKTSYNCDFEINKSKSGYIITINRTNEILKL